MQDYEPLDISPSCNAGPEILETEAAGADAKPGLNSFRGLPFLIGGQAENSLIAPTPNGNRVVIPVGKAAKQVLFAHALLETKLVKGGALGEPVAEYVFHLANGRRERVNIRERFEIAARPGFPPGTPGLPFLAVTDGKAVLMPRYVGEFGEAGSRQKEAEQARMDLCWLWAWKNPEPDSPIETIEIVPAGMRFYIAAVTLGHLDEYPFAREGRRPAKITLLDEADAAKPFDVEVEVDRGDATYVFPLPVVSSDEFLAAPYSWGQDDNESSSPSYVEISATPSATLTVKQGQSEIGKASWGHVVERGAVETERVKVELIDPGKNWVHVTVVDDETGRPTPCRVHFRSPEGVPFQPHGHHNQVNSNLGTWHNDIGADLRLGQTAFAYIDGTCQGWLPRGEVIVDVSRGFEYEPLRTKVRIEPGQQRLELRLKRWTNMNAHGWYSGDSHVHFLSTAGAHLEAQGEDLDVVNLLQAQWGSLFTNKEDFTGRASVSERGGSIVYVGQENRQHFLGHMVLWGLKKPVMPWGSDGLGEGEIGGAMESTLSHWADEAHAQGAYVISPHFPVTNGEPAALIATGRLDGIEMLRQTEFKPHRVLPVPERRLPDTPRGRHGQDVERRAGRPVSHVCPAPRRRGVQLRQLVPQRKKRQDIPERRPHHPLLGRRESHWRHGRHLRAGHGRGRGVGGEHLPHQRPADRPGTARSWPRPSRSTARDAWNSGRRSPSTSTHGSLQGAAGRSTWATSTTSTA